MAEYSRAKLETLENAVLTKSPEEVSEIFKRLGNLMNTSRALGLACRFRGLRHVKALVEGGANFTYIRPENAGGYYTIYYWLAPLDINGAVRCAFFLDIRDSFFTDCVSNTSIRREEIKSFNVIPMEERVKVVRYLCENPQKVCLDINELLFYSIMSGSGQITKVLKEYGAVISENRVKALTENGRSPEWQEFCNMADHLRDGEYFDVMGGIINELGGKTLNYTDSVYYGNYNSYSRQDRLYKPEFFKFILKNFNQKKMNKTQLMKGAIDENSAECLKICADNGWLNIPRKRDEMIKYASDIEKTECTAFLLDFKNRTADLKTEQEKAEKKLMRELNARPDSVSELQKIWGYTKREDGGLIITRYKGNRTEITVPEKIGKSVVKEIGCYAFSPQGPRLQYEQKEFRETITEIILPRTIEIIGDYAFSGCTALKKTDIFEGVEKIGAYAFSRCVNITEINIPPSVRTIGKSAFSQCENLLSVLLPEGIDAIEEDAFFGCESLENLFIPSTVRKIGRWAFALCVSLEKTVIPEGVEEMDDRVFDSCTALRYVFLPRSVKKIKNYTHAGIEPQTIFKDTEKLTVSVPPKSYAEKYCKRNNIPYTNL